MIRKNLLLKIIILTFIGLNLLHWFGESKSDAEKQILKSSAIIEKPIAITNQSNENESSQVRRRNDSGKTIPVKSLSEPLIIFDAPFAAQAPLGEWHDPRQSDGCEEASALMAVRWAREESLTLEKARSEIIAASMYAEKVLGTFQDASAKDTAEVIIKGYFQHQSAVVKPVGSVDDIVAELEAGNLVIAPVNGRLLNNPFYTSPGPERHMLLIRGYDYSTKEFITNDAGTKRGEGYRYSKNLVFDSVRDYLTGHELPINSISKVMIIISRN